MSILTSLASAYDRLEDAPPVGYSLEKISFLIALNDAGEPVGLPHDLRDVSGKKPLPRPMAVPQGAKRSSGIAPNFLWDKTSYVLGVTGGMGKRVLGEHAAFVDFHREALAGIGDPGLIALLRFLDGWSPEDFDRLGWPEEMKDQNVIFALESERLQNIHLHDRQAARDVWAKLQGGKKGAEQLCLVTGVRAPVARLHPSIKGVWGAQTAGASIVSFNLDAFTSYGHEQGDNAPVSEDAAFKYTTVLNRYLSTDSGHRVQIGDTSTVFWADASHAPSAEEAEETFMAMFAEVDEEMQAGGVGEILEKIRKGRPLKDFAPELAEGVRFCVLGLAPNAARLSVRFWFDDDFGVLARNYQRYVADMRIEPAPKAENPPIWRYLVETAVLGKRDNIQPNLAGDWMRSILSGTNYPLTLMSTVLMRIRADGHINGFRAGLLKAVLVRNFKKEVPVALDTANDDTAYVLGRLFAIMEKMQNLALGKVNASIRDRYFGTASSAPRSVFPILLRLNLHHRSKAEKDGASARLAGYFAGQMGEVMNLLPARLPATLSLQAQGTFAIGYYHQMHFRNSEKTDSKDKSE
ncbi:type I-C CRISPR-associated protein Cas8c/Csd1 [Stappia sp. GBMRC 2046]|uniref:Type I-C CRISPR-associated protein Cas8c/Csd1 n=1 Tax=Stappia sediminis TaxID=2692190 RepID=A0A7X3LXX2_9HYPH|nr:type I-C CRISPR-associated protein Cas8c/Csd1 [Stappia sediminis]MXN67130.1 type I-C CRISPR-associated protein Cas8c/Csd1 [Stappia sediminis]